MTELKTTLEELEGAIAIEGGLETPSEAFIARVLLDALFAHKQEAILNEILAIKPEPVVSKGSWSSECGSLDPAELQNETLEEIQDIIKRGVGE